MICPLRKDQTVKQTVGEKEIKEENRSCVKGKCAWWIKEGEACTGEKNDEGCALKVLAVSMAQINLLGMRVEKN